MFNWCASTVKRKPKVLWTKSILHSYMAKFCSENNQSLHFDALNIHQKIFILGSLTISQFVDIWSIKICFHMIYISIWSYAYKFCTICIFKIWPQLVTLLGKIHVLSIEVLQHYHNSFKKFIWLSNRSQILELISFIFLTQERKKNIAPTMSFWYCRVRGNKTI